MTGKQKGTGGIDLNVGDGFCGCGAFSTGFAKSGFKISWGIDNWDKATQSFKANHPYAEIYLSDIREIDGKDLEPVDVFLGAPPCQQFSKANQTPNIEKGLELVDEYFRLVKELKPKHWIMENVPQLSNYMDRYKKLTPIKVILNSADYGLPQTRRRLFAGNFPIPRQTHAKIVSNTLDGSTLCSWIGWGEALGLESDDTIELVTNVGEKLHRTYKRNLGRNQSEPGSTLNTACPPRIYTVDGRKKVRALTIEEALILQGFDKDYIFYGDRMRQIGNSVSPVVSYALSEAIKELEGAGRR